MEADDDVDEEDEEEMMMLEKAKAGNKKTAQKVRYIRRNELLLVYWMPLLDGIKECVKLFLAGSHSESRSIDTLKCSFLFLWFRSL